MTDKPPRVLAICGDENGCTLWRTWQPFYALQQRGIYAHWKLKDDPELLSQFFIDRMPFVFDAVILPRLSWKEAERPKADRYLRALHRIGLAVIYEIDDDVFSPGIIERQKATTEPNKSIKQLEQERQDRIWVLNQCDGVTVSSRRLSTIVQQFTQKPVEIVPNAIDTKWFRYVLRGCKRVEPPLTVGWAGGARYSEDLEPVAQAWKRIAWRYPDIRFVVQGHMAEVLIHSVPSSRCRRLKWEPLSTYPRAMLNIDIACCSVAPKLFNTAKTPIKLWEFTMAGAACIVSPTLYGQVATDGVDALIAETADEWEAAIVRLIEDRALRRSLHRAQRRRVASDHSMEANWWRWPAAWASLINQFRAAYQQPRIILAS